jgi:hypothetical protein
MYNEAKDTEMQEIWKAWPQWLTDAAIAAYRAGETPEMIGAVLKRRPAVVRSKLVREGVYVSKTAARKIYVANASEGF